LLLLGCSKKDNVVQPQVQSVTPQLVDGRLAFKNKTSFDLYLKELYESQDGDYNSHTTKLGLKSAYSKRELQYNRNAREEQSSTDSTAVKDSLYFDEPLLNSVMNENGEIEIGSDTIIRYTLSYSYKYHKSLSSFIKTMDTSSFTKIPKGEGLTLGNGVYVFKNKIDKITSTPEIVTSDNTNTARMDATVPVTGDTRMIAEVLNTYVIGYSSLAVITRLERQKCHYFFNNCYARYWADQNATRLSIIGTIRYKATAGGVSFIPEKTKSFFPERAAFNEPRLHLLCDWSSLAVFEVIGRNMRHSATYAGVYKEIYNP